MPVRRTACVYMSCQDGDVGLRQDASIYEKSSIMQIYCACTRVCTCARRRATVRGGACVRTVDPCPDIFAAIPPPRWGGGNVDPGCSSGILGPIVLSTATANSSRGSHRGIT